MMIARRLFVVPLANNDHGKTTIINALSLKDWAHRRRKEKAQKHSLALAGATSMRMFL